MKLAEIYYNRNFPSIKIPSYRYIIPIAIIGVGLTGITGIKGGWFKIFNDVPSLMGYLSIAILAYKLLPAYSGGYPFSISGDIRSVPS